MSDDAHTSRGPRFATAFFLICFLVLGYFLFVILQPFFSQLLWAGVLTVVFSPVFRRILRLSGGRRALASLVTCLLILLLFVLPLSWIAIIISQQSMNLYESLQTEAEETVTRLQELQKHPWVAWTLSQTSRWLGSEELSLTEALEQLVTAVSRFLMGQTPSLLKGLGQLLFGFLLMFIAMFFLFRDGPLLRKLVEESNPLPTAYESEIIKKFQDVSYAIFVGSILTAIVQGLLGAFLFWALGIRAPLFWGAIIAFVSLVPIVGAFIVWVPWTAFLLLVGQTVKGIVLLAIGGLVVSSIDNFLKPMIIQGRTDMHPMLVFLSVLGGMQAFGFQGIVLGPLIVVLFVAFLSFYQIEFRESLEKKIAERGKS